MPSDHIHEYRVSNRWTGNRGEGTASYRAYGRDHEISGQGKVISIPGSSDPKFRGDRTRYNPEELLIAALSACHMLWVLHLCADSGVVVTEYSDEAWGEFVEHSDGSGEFRRVILRPRMNITDQDRTAEVLALHERAHGFCAMARSVNFPVLHEPEVTSDAP